ncbi:MAG: cytochrome c4 [Zoogloeaceae bacterium]|nr:cytochrome c4 [Zoogloeaceae bacterium]
MRHTLAFLFFMGCAPFVAAQGDPAAGKLKSDTERCQECHGSDGNGDMGDGVGNLGKFPKLAGQKAEYLIKQLQDFRAGERKNDDQMPMMAKSISDADMADISAYFASLPVMRGEKSAADLEKGRKLYMKGDPERYILPCQSCHGEAGRGGADETIPSVGGQHRRYLVKQLSEFKKTVRQNSPDAMNQIAAALSDEEIEALADYLAAQE